MKTNKTEWNTQQVKSRCMAHYQWVYGKKKESETYAGAEAGTGGSRLHWFWKRHTVEKIWAYWNNHTSVGRSRLTENLAVHLCIIRFMTAFVLGSFKSAACRLLCGISDLFPFIYTARNCVLPVQKGLAQFKLYCSLSITARWLRKTPSCILMSMSDCEFTCAHLSF